MKLMLQFLDTEMQLPARAYSGDAGLDLSARASATLSAAGGPVAVPTGVAVAIPGGHVGLVCPRSGLALREAITVLNAPGIIDPEYRGEITVILHRSRETAYTVQRGDRIAQLLIVPVTHGLDIVISPTLPKSERGTDGMGSTGR